MRLRDLDNNNALLPRQVSSDVHPECIQTAIV
jgi:hypothetical protein